MSAAFPSGAFTDHSGTVTAGGTSQQVAPANSGRQYLLIQNLSAGDLYVNFGIAAVAGQPSYKVIPGGALEFAAASTGVMPTATINLFGATTGQAYTAKSA